MFLKTFTPLMSKFLLTSLLSSAVIPAFAIKDEYGNDIPPAPVSKPVASVRNSLSTELSISRALSTSYDLSGVRSVIRETFGLKNNWVWSLDGIPVFFKDTLKSPTSFVGKPVEDYRFSADEVSVLASVSTMCRAKMTADDLTPETADRLLSDLLRIPHMMREEVVKYALSALPQDNENRYRDVRDLLLYMNGVHYSSVLEWPETKVKAREDIALLHTYLESLSLEEQDIIVPTFLSRFGLFGRTYNKCDGGNGGETIEESMENRGALLASLRLLSYARPISDPADLCFDIMQMANTYQDTDVKELEHIYKCAKSLLLEHNNNWAEVADLVSALHGVKSQSKRERAVKLAKPLWEKMGKFSAYRAVKLALNAPENRLKAIIECAFSLAHRRPEYDAPTTANLITPEVRVLREYEHTRHTSHWVADFADLVVGLSDQEMAQLQETHKTRFKPFDSYKSSLEFVKKTVDQLVAARK